MIAPVDLSDGEFAFSNGSKKLFIGSGGDSTVNWVGAVIDNDITIDWYGLSSENNKLATQYAILSIFSSGVIEDVNISGGVVFEGETADEFKTTLSAVDPTEDRTIYLPDASGTLALVPGLNTQVVFNDNDVLGTDAGLTYNKSTDTLTIAGDLAVNGGDITTTSTATFNIVNSNATGIYLGTGAATDVRIGKSDNAGTTRLYGTVDINGGTLTTSNASSSIFDTTATTLDIGGAATTLTIGHDGTSASTTNIATGAISSGTKAVSIGTGSGASTTTNISMGSTNGGTTNIYSPTVNIGYASSGTTTLNSSTVVGASATQTLYNTVATTMNFAGAATTLTMGGTSGGTTALRNAETKLGVTTAQITTNGGTTNDLQLGPYGNLNLVPNTTAASAGGTNTSLIITNANDGAGTVTVAGGDLYLGTKNTDEFTTSAVNIIFEGATDNAFNTTLTVTDPTVNRTITLPNATGIVALIAGSDTYVLFNDGGVVGGDSGLTYNKTTDALTVTGDLAVNGGDITSSAVTFNLLNATVTTMNLGGASTAITMGDATTTTTTIRGGTLVGNLTTQSLFNTTATTLNLGGAATSLSIGAVTGTATINNANTVVTGDLAVNGGDVTTSAATATLMNATATNLSIGGAATTLTLGATSGTTAIRNAVKLGSHTATLTTNSGTTNSLTINPYGSLILSPLSTALSGGGTKANLTITNTNDGVGTVAVTGGDLYLGTKNTTEFNVYPVNIIFEGATDNAFDTTLTVTDPTANRTITLPNLTGTVALTTDLSQFAATSSAQLAVVISDETGSGALVFATSPTLVTPTLGAAAATSLTTGNTGVKVGEHASRFLTITSDGTNSAITQGGNSASALTISHAGGASVYIGDIDGLNNSTYIDVNDNNATITLNGAVTVGIVTADAYRLSSAGISAKTGSYTLVAGDNGNIITMNVASANNLTVPASLAVGFSCTVIQLGAGQTTIVASSTTLNSYQGYLKISGQYGSVSIVSYASNVYSVSGSLSA
jgi:hypothetical protein